MAVSLLNVHDNLVYYFSYYFLLLLLTNHYRLCKIFRRQFLSANTGH